MVRKQGKAGGEPSDCDTSLTLDERKKEGRLGRCIVDY